MGDDLQKLWESSAKPLRSAGQRKQSPVRATSEQGRAGELCLRPQLPHPGGNVHSGEQTAERMRGRGTVVPGSAADQFRGGRGRS